MIVKRILQGLVSVFAIAGLTPVMNAEEPGEMIAPEAPSPYIRDGDVTITSVTLDDLRLIVDEIGASYSLSGTNNTGAPFVFATTASGVPFAIYTVCSLHGEDCKGVEFLAVVPSKHDWLEIASIDRMYPAISVYQADPETVHVSRYVILDHGVKWANLRENAGVFDLLSTRVAERVSRPLALTPRVDVTEIPVLTPENWTDNIAPDDAQ